jgi:hypothetical protein
MIQKLSSDGYVQIGGQVRMTSVFDPDVQNRHIQVGKLEYNDSSLRFISAIQEIKIARIDSLAFVRGKYNLRRAIIVFAYIFVFLTGLFLLSSWNNPPHSWKDWGFLLSISIPVSLIVSQISEWARYMSDRWIRLTYTNSNGKQAEIFLTDAPGIFSNEGTKLFKKLTMIHTGSVIPAKLKDTRWRDEAVYFGIWGLLILISGSIWVWLVFPQNNKFTVGTLVETVIIVAASCVGVTYFLKQMFLVIKKKQDIRTIRKNSIDGA